MKPLTLLTNEDFEEFPIWESNSGDDQTAQALPTALKECPSDCNKVYVVKTRFKLNDGTIHFGFCSPADDSGLDYIQPVLITTRGHVRFWYDANPGFDQLNDIKTKLLKTEIDIFPVSYESLVTCDGGTLSKKIEVGDLPLFE